MKNIETSSGRYVCLSLVFICLCAVVTGFALWKSYSFAEAQRQKIYVLDNGKSLMLALSQDVQQNRPVEAREHVRRFHELFFTLSPDKSAIEGNIKRSLMLADKSAFNYYKDLSEKGYYNRVISGNINQMVQIDSVRCDFDKYPYNVRTFARQIILRDRTELSERAMDSNDIERERGITILAKNTAVQYKGTRINIMDTPGHADFGGEVERIMKMVDGVVLVVDAYEGTMPQTRFVLKKALEQHLTPIVVVNKIDRDAARPEEVVDEVLELFIELGADDDQLEFPVVYASALNGTSSLSDNPADQEKTMDYLFDTIIEHIPAPVDNSDEPLQFQVSLLDYNDYVGRIGIGRVFRGTIKVGDQVTLLN